MNTGRRFVLTAAALFALSGCAMVTGSELEKAESLFQNRKYADALVSYKKVVSQSFSSSRKAEAWYSIALIQASPDNPQRNYSLAAESFDEFLRLAPRHEKAVEALTWKNTLKLLLDEKRECDQLKKNIEQLKKLDIRHEEKRKGK